jgi:pheromone shutdown protein TraB
MEFLAGLGALVALAHPYTILSSVLAAPLTSLNPMIAAGWVSGLVEAFSRKPKVKDLESLHDDILTCQGILEKQRYQNIAGGCIYQFWQHVGDNGCCSAYAQSALE